MGVSCSSIEVQKQVFDRETPRSFKECYDLCSILGQGTHGTVYLARKKNCPEKVAVKVTKKRGMSVHDKTALKLEVEILRTIQHPQIVKCLDFFDERGAYYVVMEYMEGGDLLDRILRRKNYSEENSKFVVRFLLEAIKHCHDRNIVHRDLKPENILMVTKDSDVDIKLGDFGFASTKGDSFMRTHIGTFEYMSPEILCKKPYTKSVDMWAIGCITYDLLSGSSPFQANTTPVLFRLIRTASFSFSSSKWSGVSNEAKDFICKLLKVNPNDRLSVDEALAHPWINISEEDIQRVNSCCSQSASSINTSHTENISLLVEE